MKRNLEKLYFGLCLFGLSSLVLVFFLSGLINFGAVGVITLWLIQSLGIFFSGQYFTPEKFSWHVENIKNKHVFKILSLGKDFESSEAKFGGMIILLNNEKVLLENVPTDTKFWADQIPKIDDQYIKYNGNMKRIF